MSCVTFVARAVVRLAFTAGIFLASLVPGKAEPAPAIYYAPGENLEHVDVELINSNEREIAWPLYLLTDWPVMQALTRAADPRCEGAHLSRRAVLGL